MIYEIDEEIIWINHIGRTPAGRADVIGFGDAGVWVALSNGDGTFQPAAFVLADVGLHAGPVVEKITIDFHTLDDDLDDGTVLPPYSSNVDGLTGIVLDQDNRNFYGIGSELAPRRQRPRPVTDDVLTGVTIEFKTHNDNKESDTTFGIRIVNRISATESHDIVVATGLGQGTEFSDSGDDDDTTDVTYRRFDLPFASKSIFLRDMVLPVVYINLEADDDQWIFDYRVTLFFGGQPYSWTVSSVVLNDTQHKHMGVYSGRAFPSVFCPPTPTVQDGQARTKEVSLAFVGQKVEEVFNSRQRGGAANPLVKVKLFSSQLFGDLVPPSCSDMQTISNDPPPPDGQPLSPDFVMGTAYSHSISEVARIVTVLGLGEHVNDLNTESVNITVNPDDDQTPVTLAVKFETEGPEEVTGTYDMDIVRFDVTLRLTLRYRDATRAVDLFGWVDDIEGITATPTGHTHSRALPRSQQPQRRAIRTAPPHSS